MVFMNTAFVIERVKKLMIRAANETRKQFSINCWNTDNEILLGKNGIKVLNGHYVQVNRKSGNKKVMKKYFAYIGILWIWPAIELERV